MESVSFATYYHTQKKNVFEDDQEVATYLECSSEMVKNFMQQADPALQSRDLSVEKTYNSVVMLDFKSSP